MKLFNISYVKENGQEDVIQIPASHMDAAVKYSGIPYEQITDVELAVNNAKKCYYA